MPKCWFDSETFSPTPIRAGAWRYAEQAEVMLLPFAYEDEAPYVWDLTETAKPPAALIELAEDPAVDFWGHNSAGFDWPVFYHALRWLFDKVPQARRRDTMAQAYAHSLPGALGALCDVLGIIGEDAKDKEGKKLIQLFCVPPGKNMTRGRATRHTHPTEWGQFKTYAARDITSMRRAHQIMPKWNYPNNEKELAIWHLDNKINYRGFAVDIELAEAAIQVAETEKKRLAARTQEITDGALESTTQRDKMLAHLLAEYDVTLPDLQGATLERRIQDPDLPEGLRELLAVRLQASSTSTTKYKALMNSVSSDGRLRGTLQFCGASRTGRWAGRLFQPQNLQRVPKYVAKAWETYIEAIKADGVDLIADNVMEVAGSCVRGCIVAPAGKKLVVSDLSNIEGRMLAWLAGEEWKLQAFRDFDQGIGPDLYKLAYARAFGIHHADVDEYMRQIGKVLELALGYEGGVGAFITFAAAYGIDLDEMAEKALPGLPTWAIEEAESFYDWAVKQKRSTFGLAKRTFVACDALKRAWRAAHPATVQFWKDLGNAVKDATCSPGRTIQVQRLKIRRDGNWLRIRLPSGRFLCYPGPKVDESGQWSYLGLNQYSRKWERIKSYSGKVAENCFTGDTLVVTIEGLKRIDAITPEDLLWDGTEWVSTDGAINNGKQEVGEWLAIRVTQNHLIHDGNSWRPVTALGAPGSSGALSSARASVLSPSFVQSVETMDIQSACVLAAIQSGSIIASLRAVNHCAAALAAVKKSAVASCGTQTSFQTQQSAACGSTATPGSCVDATTPNALSTRTTEPAASPCIEAGARIGVCSSPTQRRFPVGISLEPISIESTMMATMPLEISGSSADSTIPGTNAIPSSSSTEESVCLCPNSANDSCRTGAVITLSHTTSEAAELLNGSWQSTMKAENVFDLLNCGPRSRFTVMTEFGPVIVHNCTQGESRDQLAWGMLLAEDDGYEIVSSIHDEAPTECEETDRFNERGLSAHLAADHGWNDGLPLAAAGFTAARYRK